MTSTAVLERQGTHADCSDLEGGLILAMTVQPALKVELKTSKQHSAALYKRLYQSSMHCISEIRHRLVITTPRLDAMLRIMYDGRMLGLCTAVASVASGMILSYSPEWR